MNITLADEVYDQLETKLKGAMPNVSVQALTSQDLNAETGKILAAPPAVLIAFRDEDFGRQENVVGTLYDTDQTFLLLIGAVSLRTTDEQRVGALKLLGSVLRTLIPARLKLPSNQYEAIVLPKSIGLAQLDAEGTWYLLTIVVHNVSHFVDG